MDEMTREALLESLEHRAIELAKQLDMTVTDLLNLLANRIHDRRAKAATDKVLAERWLETIL